MFSPLIRVSVCTKNSQLVNAKTFTFFSYHHRGHELFNANTSARFTVSENRSALTAVTNDIRDDEVFCSANNNNVGYGRVRNSCC